MKFDCVILASLLLVGLCSAAAPQKLKAEPSSGETESLGEKVEEAVKDEINSVLNSVTEIRGFVGTKWNQLRSLFKGCKNEADVKRQALTAVDEELPLFQDPFYIGDIIRNYKLAYINYTNVFVHGLSGFKKSELSFDSKGNTAKLVLSNVKNNVHITGNYSLSNAVKKASGPFTITFDEITYTESDIYAKYSNNEVDISKSEAIITYKNVKNDFKNLGFFTQVFRGEIGGKLSKTEVLPIVAREMGYQLRSYLLRKLRAKVAVRSTSGDPGTNDNSYPSVTVKPENKLEEIVKGVVSEARVLLEKGGYSNIDLPGIPIYFPYKELTGHIAGVNVSGLCTFELVNLKTETKNNKVQVLLDVKTASLSGYAQLVLPEEQLGEVPLNIGFNIDHVVVALAFDKPLNDENAWFQLTDVKVQVQKLVPVEYSSYTESQLALLRNQLPSIVASVINQRLAALIKGAIEQSISDASGQQGLEERSNFGSK